MTTLNDNLTAIKETLWDNYYKLAETPRTAMATLWFDYANGHLFPWIQEEYLITEEDLLDIIASLTDDIKYMDSTAVAMLARRGR